MHIYFTDRYQRVKISNFYNFWSIIKHRGCQGSILGPVLFNIFLCDMFFMIDTVDIDIDTEAVLLIAFLIVQKKTNVN